jgi:hypothetical protein
MGVLLYELMALRYPFQALREPRRRPVSAIVE